MVGWHHRRDGHEFEQAPAVGARQGSLTCCIPWGRKESDATEQLNWTELNWEGWDGRGEGGIYMYICTYTYNYDWFVLYSRNQRNIVKQLSSNWKKKRNYYNYNQGVKKPQGTVERHLPAGQGQTREWLWDPETRQARWEGLSAKGGSQKNKYRSPLSSILWAPASQTQPETKRQGSPISALLTMPKPLTVWITTNCGKFWKRWEYQTTSPVSWENCMQVRKQQLKLDMKQQTGSK